MAEQLFGDAQVAAFEASGGTEANTLRGVPIVVVTTVGRTSGRERKIALMRVEHEGRYALVASKGGAPSDPVWFANIVAHPRLQLQDGPVRRDYLAHVADDAERSVWWPRCTQVWPDYDDYQQRTDRRIPVVVLEPVGD